ncbi:hypothetical protein ACJJI5_13905 [Microbulbifer sp. EKSA008]|uniref:hypothetical protein n=1 Tax=Microbulbifer sp. EKSA008 TaxID=3243367 RepID=UPI0040427C65
MKIEVRQMFRSNGLIDDLVLSAKSEDYLLFADAVGKAIGKNESVLVISESEISIEIICDETKEELFTALQNKANDYFSMDDWNSRNILRVYGSAGILASFQRFLVKLAGRGPGYSYISEYSEGYSYSIFSPEWRLHIEPS